LSIGGKACRLGIMSAKQEVRIGYAGLGLMGAPMVQRLLECGYRPKVWNRTSARAEPLLAIGAEAAATPAALGEACDVVGLCLPTVKECREVMEEQGLLPAMGSGSLLLNFSTIGPEQAKALDALCCQHQVKYVDAPVSGGPAGSAAGTLSIMVGCEEAVLAEAQPVLEDLGAKIVRIGEVGAGQVAKLANNLIAMITYVGLQEGFELARRYDVDPGLVYEALSAATANSTALKTRAPVEGLQPDMPPSQNWQPGFATDMMAKDLDLALESARKVDQKMVGTELGRAMLKLAQDHGLGGEDYSDYAKLMRC